MEGFWPIFFLAVVLKIPVGMLLYLVWWAFRASTIPEEPAPPDPEDHRFHRFRREPKRPRGPRRGPHGPGEARPLPGSAGERREPHAAPPRPLTRARTPTTR